MQVSQALQGGGGENVSTSIEHLVAPDSAYTDTSVHLAEKLKAYGTYVHKWLMVEVDQKKVLSATHSVTSHSSFGHMSATIMMSCTCGHTGDSSSCSLHCASPSLSDIVFIISQAVHPVFSDGFMCFANLMADQSSSGIAVLFVCFFFESGNGNGKYIVLTTAVQ